MIYKVDIARVRETAKTLVMNYHVGLAESDGVPAQLRAMYVLKLQEAKRVLSDEESELISGEAALRGVTPQQMAQVIVNMSESSARLELSRMQFNVRIETAQSEAEIVGILGELGLRLSMQADTQK